MCAGTVIIPKNLIGEKDTLAERNFIVLPVDRLLQSIKNPV